MDFTWNGRHSTEFEIASSIKKWPTLPQMAVNKQAVGGRNGTLRYPGGTYNERTLTMQLYLLADDLEDDAYMLQRGRELARWLAPGERRQLILDAAPEHYFIAEVEKAVELSDSDGWSNGRLEVTFTLQPFYYWRRENRATAVVSANVASTITLSVSGDYVAPLLLDITATEPLDTLCVTCAEQRMRFTGLGMQPGDLLCIDATIATGEVATCTLRGVPHMDKLDHDSDIPLLLQPREPNSITLLADGGCGVTAHATGRCL